MAIVIRAIDGKQYSIKPKNGKCFTPNEINNLLDCQDYIIYELYDQRIMIADIEGKLKKEWKINIAATELFLKGDLKTAEIEEFIISIRKRFKTNIDLGIYFTDLDFYIIGDVLVCQHYELS